LRLRDYLSVRYVLQAETVEVAPGSWIRRVAYPELPGCTAECLLVRMHFTGSKGCGSR
jgi:hypothetical protein